MSSSHIRSAQDAAWSDIEWSDNIDGIAEAERPRRIKRMDGKTESGADTVLQEATVDKDGDLRAQRRGECTRSVPDAGGGARIIRGSANG